MPRYFNPTNHKVTIGISDPRVTLILWPRSWAASQLPDKAVTEVELDERLARSFVQLGLLQLSPPIPVTAPEALPSVSDPLSADHPMRALERAQDAQALGDQPAPTPAPAPAPKKRGRPKKAVAVEPELPGDDKLYAPAPTASDDDEGAAIPLSDD